MSKFLRFNKLFKTEFFRVFVFILVLYFTFVLRAHNYEKTPVSNHLDEQLYGWSGMYLIETGTPVSWSTLDYPKWAEVYKGERKYEEIGPKTSVTLYKPWLDEPPLFSLLVGYFAHVNHADREQFIPSSYIRIPMIIIGALTGIMVFIVTRMVSGYWAAVLAMLFFGTIPTLVFGTRSAMPENLISLLYILMIWLFLKFNNTVKWVYVLPIPILAGIAGLSKPTGFFLIPLAVLVVFKKCFEAKDLAQAIKMSLFLVLATLPFIGLFIAYGIHYSPEIFWRITEIQSLRPAGFASLGWFFITPAYKTDVLVDSWYIFCLISVAYFIFSKALDWKSKKLDGQMMILLAFIYWVGVVMISGGENDLLPWYRYPAFPYLAIIGTWGIQLLVKNANILTTFLAAGLLLGNRMLLVNAFKPNILPAAYRQIMVFLMLPSVLNTIFNKKILEKVSRLVMLLIIIFGVYINSVYIYSEYQIRCENVSCPVVPTTKLSEIYFPILWRFFDVGQRQF